MCVCVCVLVGVCYVYRFFPFVLGRVPHIGVIPVEVADHHCLPAGVEGRTRELAHLGILMGCVYASLSSPPSSYTHTHLNKQSEKHACMCVCAFWSHQIDMWEYVCMCALLWSNQNVCVCERERERECVCAYLRVIKLLSLSTVLVVKHQLAGVAANHNVFAPTQRVRHKVDLDQPVPPPPQASTPMQRDGVHRSIDRSSK